jgi:hypothetical protein
MKLLTYSDSLDMYPIKGCSTTYRHDVIVLTIKELPRDRTAVDNSSAL